MQLISYKHVQVVFSEKSDALQESGYNAATVGQKIQKGDLNQLRKSENPYRPPHRDKVNVSVSLDFIP